MDLGRRQFTTEFAGRPLVLEVSRLAEQAAASVLGRYGETVVLAAVTAGRADKPVNYFPLTVDYEERFYAAGKVLGSRFVRREGRPSENAVLSGRLIDRVIRPLFDHRMRRDVQVVVTVLAIDEANDPEFVGLLAASTALAISPIPWGGPVAGVSLMKMQGDSALTTNPTDAASRETCEFFTFVAGTEDRVSMIELEGKDAREEDVVRAFHEAQRAIARLVDFQHDIVRAAGSAKVAPVLPAPNPALISLVNAFLAPALEETLYLPEKTERETRMTALRVALMEHLAARGISEKELPAAEHLFEEAVDALVHRNILERGRRPDGRALTQVRDLYAEVGLFGRTHGSALFVRGNTQSLATTTLAAPNAEQLIETMEFSGTRRFLLHYNFPPYSVGETGPFRGPGRREIGHGALAAKALRRLIPPKETFPYTIRVVSEILSSNGSSSMATVSAASLALMDAGVPIEKPAAGIAMGLMMDDPATPSTSSRQADSGQGRYKILTDIQGPEDHYGDMDFKAAGTKDGLSAVQMDVKIKGLTPLVLEEVLREARAARLHILSFMEGILPHPRPALSPHAPVILVCTIPPQKIGDVIGPGGKIINGIIAATGVIAIDIEENGQVFITAADRGKAEAALGEVKAITRTYEVGEVVEGQIVKLLDFGVIVELGPRQDGMIHVSELKNGYVKAASDVVKVGERVRAKIIRVDPDGRIGLSLKQLQQ